MSRRKPIDRLYLVLVIILAFGGFFIFSSASLGLLVSTGPGPLSVVINQSIGLVIGLTFFYIFSRIDYQLFRRYAFYLFIAAILCNLALYIPHLSLYYGGASRWIALGPITFQPSELLKLAFIIYFGAWLAHQKKHVSEWREGLLPFLILMTIAGVILLAQRDTVTFIIIFATGLCMLIVAGGKFSHIAIALAVIVATVALVALVRPYARERIMTYIDPSADPQGSGYQVQQSLIAVGSGGVFGKGYGQSIQKFGYLPEPVGDSIFAVAAEEFGFIGTVILVIVLALFAIQTLRIASRTNDIFGRMLALGIGVLVIIESFMNVGSAIGLIPLSGIPLLFVSHGGTALIIVLSSSGIVAGISRKAK